MTRPQLVVNVYGGGIQDVFSSIPDLQVLVVDWDAEKRGSPSFVELALNGVSCSASVVELDVLSVKRLTRTDVKRALDAARKQEVFHE